MTKSYLSGNGTSLRDWFLDTNSLHGLAYGHTPHYLFRYLADEGRGQEF
jgi:hypothetical protein